jgi:hypothetical protein
MEGFEDGSAYLGDGGLFFRFFKGQFREILGPDLGDGDLPVVDLKAELREKGRLDVADDLLRAEARAAQYVDLIDTTLTVGNDLEGVDSLDRQQELLDSAETPRVDTPNRGVWVLLRH